MKKEKELEQYIEYLKKEAKNFELTHEDLGNLYDLFYLVEIDDFEDTLEVNGMLDWFKKFFVKLDKVVIKENERRN